MKRTLLLCAALCLLRAQDSAAQRFGVESAFSLAAPRGAVAERWGVGAGLGVRASVQLDRHHALYAGYSATHFDLDFLDDMHASDRGFSAGAVRSFGPGPVVPWANAGVLVHRLAIVREGEGAPPRRPADGETGFEAGAGVRLELVRFLRPLVGIEYRRYRGRVLREEREDVSYTRFRLGLGTAF